MVNFANQYLWFKGSENFIKFARLYPGNWELNTVNNCLKAKCLNNNITNSVEMPIKTLEYTITNGEENLNNGFREYVHGFLNNNDTLNISLFNGHIVGIEHCTNKEKILNLEYKMKKPITKFAEKHYTLNGFNLYTKNLNNNIIGENYYFGKNMIKQASLMGGLWNINEVDIYNKRGNYYYELYNIHFNNVKTKTIPIKTNEIIIYNGKYGELNKDYIFDRKPIFPDDGDIVLIKLYQDYIVKIIIMKSSKPESFRRVKSRMKRPKNKKIAYKIKNITKTKHILNDAVLWTSAKKGEIGKELPMEILIHPNRYINRGKLTPGTWEELEKEGKGFTIYTYQNVDYIKDKGDKSITITSEKNDDDYGILNKGKVFVQNFFFKDYKLLLTFKNKKIIKIEHTL